MLDDNKVYTIFAVPLINVQEKFTIYKAHNLPFPFIHNSSSMTHTLVAVRDLESQYIAVNPARTNYMLLKPADVQQCLHHSLKFCTLNQPIYPVNLSPLCIISLFMNKPSHVGLFCKTLVKTTLSLPHAEYISDGNFVIATNKHITFTKICHSKRADILPVTPPIGLIQLEKECTAVHDSVTLPAYYFQESKFKIHNYLRDIIQNYNFTTLDPWKPFHLAFPKFNVSRFPNKLADIKETPMSHLIKTLGSMDDIQNEPDPKVIWPYFLAGTVVVFLLAIFILWYTKFRGKNNACCSLRHLHKMINTNTTDMTNVTPPVTSTPEMIPLQERSAPPMYPVLELANRAV